MRGLRQTPAVGVAVSALLGALVLVAIGPRPAGAVGITYTVTESGLCGGSGSFQAVLAQANAHPGIDTIEFTPGLRVSGNACTSLAPPIHGYPLSATESVDIVANGATIAGDQVYVRSDGLVNDPNSCPSSTAGTLMAAPSTGFLEVGTYDVDNTGVVVTMHDVTFSGMPSLFLVERGASLSLSDATAAQTLSFNDDCRREPIFSNNGNVSLARVTFVDSSAPHTGVSDASSTSAVVAGFGAGDLVMDHVRMSNNADGRAVIWNGDSAKIVSSQFYESGGLRLDAISSEVVNTVWRTKQHNAVDRIVSTEGIVRSEASTFFWTEPTCGDGCQAANLGFVTAGTGVFDLHSTAIGAGADYPGAQPLLWGNTTTGFTSDNLTWVQPTGAQDATAIHAILPDALTAAPGLNASFVTSFTGGGINDATPLLGTVSLPGVLVDAVSDSSCAAPDDANQLVNPIDSTCITTDVFGNPRWDSGNKKRNIGAVQNIDTPHLAVTAVGDTTVDLQWNQPVALSPATITGYSIFYRPTGNGPFTQIDVTGAETTGHTVTGLTNGTDYEFEMVAVSTEGVGPLSNVVHATPYALVGVPDVSAVPGGTDVRLFWTVPSTGGHSVPFRYFVTYRPIGGDQWFNGPGNLSGRTADIPELACGINYEFGVIALSADGTASPTAGTTIATPTAPCPEPTPPTTTQPTPPTTTQPTPPTTTQPTPPTTTQPTPPTTAQPAPPSTTQPAPAPTPATPVAIAPSFTG